MKEANLLTVEIKPVAVFLDQGKVMKSSCRAMATPQQLKAYDQLERAAKLQTHRSLVIEIQPLETALKKVAHKYGWKGGAT